jgi:hypothetical protein
MTGKPSSLLGATPVLIGKIEIDVSGLFGGSNADRPFRAIEARASSRSSVELLRGAGSFSGPLVIAAPQGKTLAADGPGAAMSAGRIEIVLEDGVRILVDRDVDADALARVIGAILRR